VSTNVKTKGIEDAKKVSQIPFQLENFRNLPVRNIMGQCEIRTCEYTTAWICDDCGRWICRDHGRQVSASVDMRTHECLRCPEG